MNIFESIGRTTRRIEPIHSQFLADALLDSVNGDRSLFEAFWTLVAPAAWKTPEAPEIRAEEVVPGQGRIDITIRSSASERSIVGIEVKTTDSSVTSGQLERYKDDLVQANSDYEVAIAYLTPFNRARSNEKAAHLSTVKEFEAFASAFSNAKHVSWLDVARIPWDGNELWRQHQLYVYQHISSHEKLRVSGQWDRPLDSFFGGESTDAFWMALDEIGIGQSEGGGAVIELVEFGDIRSLAARLAEAFEILIRDGEGVSHNANRSDSFDIDLRQQYLDSPFREVHEALFNLSERFSHVWLQGRRDYGVRVAHSNSGSVSLVTSLGPGRLEIVGQR